MRSRSDDVALMCENLARLSCKFVHCYWNGQVDWCCDRVAEDAVMVLLGEDVPVAGADALRQAFERLAGSKPRVILLNEAYNVSACGDYLFSVMGTCTAYLSAKGAGMQERTLRASLLWRSKLNNDMELVQGHFSLGEGPAIRNESRKVAVAEREAGIGEDVGNRGTASLPDADEHVRRIIKSTGADDTRNIVVRDKNGTTRFFNSNDIRYLRAQGRRTEVFHRTGSLCVPQPIGKLAQEVGGAFVPLHRSYLVNAFFIESLSRAGCVLDDGTVLPVPVRRLIEIRAAVARILQSG